MLRRKIVVRVAPSKACLRAFHKLDFSPMPGRA
jgi:hypothetical protein